MYACMALLGTSSSLPIGSNKGGGMSRFRIWAYFPLTFLFALGFATHGQNPPISFGKQSATPAPINPGARARVVEGYGKLPLAFEANQGQTAGQVKFLSRGSGYTLFLTSDEAVLALKNRQSSVVNRQLSNAKNRKLRLKTRRRPNAQSATDHGPRTT